MLFLFILTQKLMVFLIVLLKTFFWKSAITNYISIIVFNSIKINKSFICFPYWTYLSSVVRCQMPDILASLRIRQHSFECSWIPWRWAMGRGSNWALYTCPCPMGRFQHCLLLWKNKLDWFYMTFKIWPFDMTEILLDIGEFDKYFDQIWPKHYNTNFGQSHMFSTVWL